MKRPGIGVAVLVFKGNALLMQQRFGSHGEGSWSVPGGHIDFGEEPETSVGRELKEETGLTATEFTFIDYNNVVFQEEGKHYITLMYATKHIVGEPQTMEPEKCKHVGFYPLDDLPSPLFAPLQKFVDKHDLKEIATRFQSD